MTRLIRTTYEIITPESSENGDFEETGWVNEEGESMEPDEIDAEEGLTAVDLAIRFLKDKGVECASASHFHPGVWFDGYYSENYRTGASTRESYHLVGFTTAEHEAIFDAVK